MECVVDKLQVQARQRPPPMNGEAPLDLKELAILPPLKGLKLRHRLEDDTTLDSRGNPLAASDHREEGGLDRVSQQFTDRQRRMVHVGEPVLQRHLLRDFADNVFRCPTCRHLLLEISKSLDEEE